MAEVPIVFLQMKILILATAHIFPDYMGIERTESRYGYVVEVHIPVYLCGMRFSADVILSDAHLVKHYPLEIFLMHAHIRGFWIALRIQSIGVNGARWKMFNNFLEQHSVKLFL